MLEINLSEVMDEIKKELEKYGDPEIELFGSISRGLRFRVSVNRCHVEFEISKNCSTFKFSVLLTQSLLDLHQVIHKQQRQQELKETGESHDKEHLM